MKNFKHLNSWALSLALLSLPLFSTTASGADEVEEVVAVGSRREARSVGDSPAPVDIITGSEEDVSVLQAQKQYDLQVVERSIAKLEERMSYAFLLHTAIQRDAERVTAQEIRYMAEQLETAMGGVYSLLSQEFQLPLVKILMKRMQESKEIPPLPKNSVKPTIITGIEALGRGNDLQKLREFVAEIGNLAQINPQVVQALNPDDLIKRIAIGLGIDTDGLLKSPEQLAQEAEAQAEQAEQQQVMQMAEKAVAPVANNLSKPQ